MGSVCAFQVAGRSLGFWSLLTGTPLFFVLFLLQRLGALLLSWLPGPSVLDVLRVAFRRHRGRESGGSVRMRRLERSMLLLTATKNVH